MSYNYRSIEDGNVVRIKNRILGRRKLENIWGEEKWEVEGRIKGTSIQLNVVNKGRNRIHLRVIKDEGLDIVID